MKNKFHRWVLMLFILLPSLLKANLIKVNDLGDPTPTVAGNKNLRDAIMAAAPGDTVIMDIKGSIGLTSNLIINKPIHIIGAYPVHNVIVVSPGAEIQFNFVGPPPIHFSGFRVVGSGTSGTSGIRVFANTYVVMDDCVIENFNSTSNGGAIFVSGHLSANYCSFLNNQSSLEGGAVHMSNGTFADFNSCTFGTNSAAQGGGAIYCSGSLQVNNCTFANNNSSTAGRDIKSNLAGALVTSFNSIYAHTVGGPADFFNGSGSWFSQGGNSFTSTPPGGTFTGGVDQTVSAISLGMTALHTDGYGLKYYRLIPGSVAIDYGQTAGGTLPPRDCRRAPRTLYGGATNPDCGAFEFSPYTVTNTSGSSATSGSFPNRVSQIAATGNPGPYFIDFGIGSPGTIISAAPMLLTKPQTIIDGYTEASSMVPGPGLSVGTVTPGVMGFNVQSSSTLNDILNVSNTANNTSISGLGFYSAYYGIAYSGSSNTRIFGNYFFGMGQAGVYANVSSGIMIGGERHFQRNILSNSVTGLKTLQTSNVKIQGNFIGTDDIGMNLTGSGNGTGIYAVQANGMLVGGDHFRGRGNIISGTITNGIQLDNSSNIGIHGNYIGLNYNGTGAIENHYNGIYINGSGTNIRIGRPGKDFRNYICNSDLSDVNNSAGIQLQSYTGGDAVIFNNSIGVDKNNINAPNATGVIIEASGGVQIGDGSIKNRNVICNSLNNGIYIDGVSSSSAYINKNFIGLKEDNGPGPNLGYGIMVGADVANSTFINNVISSNQGDGVHLGSSGSGNSVSGNFIGTDTTGNSARPNLGHGVSANLLTSGMIMFSNIISGNNLDGVNLVNCYNVLLYNNVIGLNTTQSAVLANNQNGIRAIACPNLQIGNSTNGNTIAGNAGSGVHISNGNGFVIVRNFIGTNPSEAAGLGNGMDGVYMDGTSTLGTIGNIGTTGDSNTVMYNGRHGVFVDGSSYNVGVSKNHFAFNAQKGIALTGGGPLVNDTDDADAGGTYGNDGQNYPVLTMAQRCGTDTKIAGSINVDAMGTDYHLEFYSVGTPDASGHGEGLHFLGEIILNDPSSHTIPFIYNYAGLLSPGTIITSTCTKRPGGGVSSTSEFSNNITVVPTFTADAIVTVHEPCYGDFLGETHCDATGAALPISLWNWIRVGAGSVGTGQDNYGLNAGFYTCQVTDATGCQVYSDTIEITEPAALVPNASVLSNETCAGLNDGSATSVPTGGTGGYNYQWTNSASVLVLANSGPSSNPTGLAPDTYIVSVTDANLCTASETLTVNPGLIVTANFTAAPTTICAGDNVTFTDLSSGGTTWFWDFGDFTNTTLPTPPAHTYASSGVYTAMLTLTNGTCSGSFSTTITVNAPYAVNAGSDLTICESAPTVLLGGTTTAPSVSWTTLGGGSFTSPSTASTSYTLSAGELSSGTAGVVFTATDGICTSSDTLVVSVDHQPTIVLGSDFSQCATSTFALAPASFSNVSAFSWSTTGTGSFTAPTSSGTSYDPATDAGTTVTLSLTGTSSLAVCPAATDNVDVTVLTAPSANAGLDAAVCYSNGSYSFTGATAANYTTLSWSTLASGTLAGSSTLNPMYTFAPADEGNTIAFVLTAQNPSCAPVSDTVLITVDEVPTVNAGIDDVVCSGSTITLTGSVGFATSQTWTSTGGGSFSNQFATVTDYTTALTSGTDTVSLITGTNGACNAQADFLLLTVNPAPTVDVGPDIEVCNTTASTTFNATVTGGGTLLWTATQPMSWVPGPTGPTVDAFYSGAATSSGSVDLILTSTAPGCAPVDDTVHVVFTLPHSAYAGPDAVACSSMPVTLTGAGITGPTGITSTWSGAGTFSPSPATLTGVTYTPTTAEITAGTATVTLTTDPLGACATATDAMTITLLTTPVANAGADQSVCPGSVVTLDGSGSTGAITTYQWDEVSGPAIGSTVTVNVTPVANTSYILTVDNGTCSDADTVDVTLTTPPDASFSYASAPFCANDADELPVAAAAGGYYDVVGGLGVTINTATGEIYPSLCIPGTYNIYHELTTPCLSRDTISVTIYATPSVTVSEITGDYTACQFDTLYFTGAPAGGTYTALIGLNTGTGEYTGLLPGSYNVVYNYTDGVTGCSSSDSKNVTVNALPVVSFSPTLAATYCTSDGPVLLTGSPAGATGGFALNGSLFPGSTYSYDPATPGTDSIAYGYIDPLTGCGNFDFQLVTVTSAPATPILATAAPYEFCESAPQTLTVSNPATIVTWYNDAGLTSVVTTGTNCSSSLLGSGTNTVYVVNKTSGTCVSVPLAVTYTNHTFDGFSLNGPYETCSGTPVEINMTVPVGVTYGWLPDTGLTDTTAIHPMVTPLQTTTYTVMLYITSLPSCVMYDSVRVDVKPCSLEDVTNAFSPDGDGVNDTWIIAGIEQHPQNRVRIYNRWGDEMIVLDGYNNTTIVWDGMYKGTKVATGTYYYVIEYMDDGQQAAGWLQLNY